jgi:hypothetical protein
VAARQRHQHPGVQVIVARSLDLAADERDRALPVLRQYVVAEAGEIHDDPPVSVTGVNARPRPSLHRPKGIA